MSPREIPAVRVRCHAKTNPYLRIVRRRDDGFHELETVFLSVSLADELEARIAEEPGVRLEMAGPFAEALAGENPEKNLAVRAWRATEALLRSRGSLPGDWPADLESKTGSPDAGNRGAGVVLRLTKNIPIGAGLAGGSADAAGAISACCALAGSVNTDAGASQSANPIDGAPFVPTSDLLEIAATLGSDVPFCLQGGCAFGRGRGERLEAWPVPSGVAMLLVKPRFSISTAEAYAACRPEGPASEAHLAAMRDAGSDLGGLFHNTFYQPALPHYNELRAVETRLRTAGAGQVQLSGSGSAMIGVFDLGSGLEGLRDRLAASDGIEGAWIVRPVGAGVVILPSDG